MDAKTLLAKLQIVEDFRKLTGGLFGGGAKKAFKLWSSANKKGVAALVELFAGRDGNHFAKIVAFSTHGEIDDQTLAKLNERLDNEQFAPSTVVYLGHWLDGWEQIAGAKTKFEPSFITAMSGNGLFVLPLISLDKKDLDADWVLWAEIADGVFAYLITNKMLKKIAR